MIVLYVKEDIEHLFVTRIATQYFSIFLRRKRKYWQGKSLYKQDIKSSIFVCVEISITPE